MGTGIWAASTTVSAGANGGASELRSLAASAPNVAVEGHSNAEEPADDIAPEEWDWGVILHYWLCTDPKGYG